MLGVGLPELVLIAGVALVVVGPERLPRLMRELGRDGNEIAAVEEPPGADYCDIRFTDETLTPSEISTPRGAGESQEQDEIRRALQYRFRA